MSGARGDKWGEVIRGLLELARRQIPVQTVWATCKEVHWEERTMTVVDLLSGLDMFDVWCGLGSVMYRPKVGTKLLLGLVQNHDGLHYLIYAEEIEEIAITSTNVNITADKVTINDGKHGGMVKVEDLKKGLDATNQAVNKILAAINGGTPATGAPDSGAALIASMKAIITGASVGDFSNIENKDVKH